MPPPAAMSPPSYELGRTRLLAELPEVREQPAAAALLSSPHARLRCYRESDESPYALAQRSAGAALARSGVRPEAVDVVVFASDSIKDGAELGRWLADLGLTRAYPLNVTLSDCANLPIALRVAAGLVQAGEFARALVVSVDVARFAAPASRLIGGGVAVASDGAASLLLDAEGPLVVEASAQFTDAAMLDSGGRVRSSLAARVRAHRALFTQLLGRAALLPAMIQRIFPNHFAAQVLLPFFEDSGFRREQIRLESAAEAGHCFGSDCLIGLADHLNAAGAAEGEHFLLVGAGTSQLGAVLLRATRPIAPCAESAR